MSYPGQITQIRAYAFALTAGKGNDGKFNAENFVTGLSRFGVEVPAPNISERCQMYGNSRGIIAQLRIAEKTYGKMSMKVHFKRYQQAPLTDQVPKRPILGKVALDRVDADEAKRREEEFIAMSDDDKSEELVVEVPIVDMDETTKPVGERYADPPAEVPDMHASGYIQHARPHEMEGSVTDRVANALGKD